MTDPNEDMIVRVWDQDLITSDAVGFVNIKISSLIINCGTDSWFDIMYKNSSAGQIHL